MKRLLIAVAFAFAAAAPSLAADLPQPMPPPPPQAPAAYIPVTAPVYNWGGIYYGINVGYGFGQSEWSVGSANTGNFNVRGFELGGTVGANVQADAFVFGVEGDLGASWINGTSNKGLCSAVACETRNTWLGTLRGRIGYAADRVLLYGTAGGAFANIQEDIASNVVANANKMGWTAGAGVEAAFGYGLTARIEYLFVDMQNASFSNGVTVKYDTNLVRLGLDYKFR